MAAKWSNTSYFTNATAGDITAGTSYLMGVGATGTSNFRISFAELTTYLSTAFKALTLAAGALTASAPWATVTQTWNNSGVTFIGQDVTITDTASAAGSLLARWSVGANVIASIGKTGTASLSTGTATATYGPALAGTTSADNMVLQSGGTSRWSLTRTASTSELTSSQVTARIVGGATNGLAVRNSGNTRDNFSVSENGATFMFSNGTQIANIFSSAASGETRAGYSFAGGATASWVTLKSFGAGTSSGICGLYFDGTVDRSAFEIPNVGSGFGALALMKSGGTVTIGANSSTTAGLTIQNAVQFDQDATATNTRMLLYVVDTGTVQRVKAITNAAILTLLGLGAGRLLYVPA